jgi:basic amino acid/polyamine antiporter, APA family
MTQRMEKPGQKLGFFMAIALIMGNMIGSGVFLLPSSLAPFGWNAVAGWILTIAGSLCLAHVFARLTLALPEHEGPTEFVTHAFGAVPGFMVGWAYWVSIWTTNVTLGVAAISYASIFWPALGQHGALGALVLLWAITAINLRGARAAGGFQMVTLIIKLVPLIAVMALIAVVLTRQGGSVITPFPSQGLSASAVGGSAILTLWAMLGFESASVAADKVENPARTIPRATMIGTAATGLIYLVACSGIALMLPADQVTGSNAPFSIFVERYGSHGSALLIAGFATISAIGALNGWSLLQGVLPATMARKGLLPAWLAGETGRGVPARALILSSVISSVFVILNSDKSTGQLFEYLAKLSTSATLWLYLACALAALRFRVAMMIAVLGAAYSLWTIWGAGIDISALSFILMAAGLPFYGWARRNSRPMIERSANTS